VASNESRLPRRGASLEIFTRGQPYHQLLGQPGGELTREQVAEQVVEFMAIMEPTYLQDTSDIGKKTQRFLLVAGFLVAAANGRVEQSEINALATILGPRVSPSEIQAIVGQPVGALREEAINSSKDLVAHMTGVQKLKLIRDMVVISFADGTIDNEELAFLVWFCQNLGIDPQFVQQIITSATQGVD
jgi:uncharacterized tellurite resistance protein B-like protein